MDFLRSLPLDLQILVVAIVGCVMLALFSGNQKAEKRYMLVLVVLAATGTYRFAQTSAEDPSLSGVATRSAPHPVTPPPVHKPLVSTSAR